MLLPHVVLLLIMTCLQCSHLLVGLLKCITLLLQLATQQAFLLLPLQSCTLLLRLAAAECILHKAGSISTQSVHKPIVAHTRSSRQQKSGRPGEGIRHDTCSLQGGSNLPLDK